MVEHLWDMASQHANTIAALAAVFAVLIGLFTAAAIIPQLIAIKRTFQLDGTRSFLELAAEVEDERYFVYQQLPIVKDQSEESLKVYDALSEEEHRRAQKVISSLNSVGILLSLKCISKKAFFGTFHTMIIRLCFQLVPYTRYHELKVGGRYGRRLLDLKRRAQLYHDIYPRHRIHPIFLLTGTTRVEVYRTSIGDSIGARRRKQAIWLVRRTLSLY
jgi:hypothetical protein